MFNFLKSKKLSQDQAFEQLANDKSIRLVDVRTKEEYRNDGHVKGSVNVPLDTIPTRFASLYPNKDEKIFVICYSGARAGDAVSYLTKIGYTNVTNIGGVATWRHGLVK
jgi:rhodanese-related sulfurtransferase